MLVSGKQQSDSAIHTHVSILFPLRLLQNIEQNSPRCRAGPYWLSILNTTMCTCQPQRLLSFIEYSRQSSAFEEWTSGYRLQLKKTEWQLIKESENKWLKPKLVKEPATEWYLLTLGPKLFLQHHTEKEVARLKGTGHITLKKGSEVTRCYPVRETEAPPVGPMDFIMPHHASHRSPGLQTEPSPLMWKRNQSSSMGITPSIEIPSLFMKEVSDKCLPSQVELSSCSSKSVKQDLCHPGLHGKHQKKWS